MFGLYFLAPVYLFAASAVAIPLFIHLYYRQRARVVFFSTIRFIRKSFERKARWLRIQDALLLLLRVLLFTLIPLALAKPALRTRGAVPFLSRPTTTAVLVIDNSFSMGAVVEGIPAFERARTAAKQVVETFSAGDEIAVYLVNSKMEGVISEPSLDRKAVQDALEGIALSSSNTRYQNFLEKCVEVLRGGHATNKEIFLFTDFQACGWDLLQAISQTLPPNAALYLVDCGRDHVPNAAITALTLDALPKVVGRPVRIYAAVKNFSESALDTTVNLFVGEKVAAQKVISLGARGEEKVQFEYVFPAVGQYRISTVIINDLLEADNKRSTQLTIAPRVKVLTVGGKKSGLNTLGDTFYLDVALHPRLSKERPETQSLELTNVTATDMIQQKLADFNVVFLANVASLSDNQMLALEEYVALGGNLAIFLGKDADPDNYTRQFASERPDKESLMAGKFRATTEARTRTLRDLDLQHPLFVNLAKEARDDLFQTRFQRAWDVQLSSQARVFVPARFDDGTPAILQKSVGRGKVLLFNMSADREWTTLPLRPVFPVLVHQVVRYLNGSKEVADEIQVGQSIPFVSSLESGRAPWLVRRPDGRVDTVLLKPDQGFLRGRYLAEGPPGVFVAEREKEPPFTFVVNLDTTESDLVRVDPEKVRRYYGEKSVQLVSHVDQILSALKRSREGVRLWPLLLALVAVLFFLENWLSNRMSQEQPAAGKKEGKQPNIGNQREKIATPV
jgi:hypothetical protein